MQVNIPQETTSFVGRTSELATLEEALARYRLVTLVGAGGLGKTRLAQRAAANMTGEHAVPGQGAATAGQSDLTSGASAARFPDGVWWADLSTLQSPRLLLATVSDAVDLADHSPRMPVEVLCEWLADKTLLLVLDSCEHVIEDCAHLVGDLLTAVPGLTVLATSRQPISSRGEHLIEVFPLPISGPEALTLFDERVKDKVGHTPLAAPGAAQAAESICRRLEGIPLAIELAAAQVGPAAVVDVAARLGSRFDVLTRSGFVWPRRHQTLRTTIGWSHELCAPLERLLWARLSVFRGTFTLAAAEAVTSGGPLDAQQVASALERLVAQSVVRRTPTDRGDRYRMLDTIREYGDAWLQELGEVDVTGGRHADYFTALARRAEADWPGGEQLTGYQTVEDFYPDLCGAVDHWLVHDPAAAADLVGLLVYFWACCGHLKEARSYLERALELHIHPDATRTRALIRLGAVATLQGDYALAAEVGVVVQAAVATSGDREERVGAACFTGLLGMLTGQPQAALDSVRNALEQAPGSDFASSDRLRCRLIEVLSLTALGSFAEGQAGAIELRENCVRRGELWTRSYLDYQLSLVALFSSVPAESITYARSMLESKRLLGDAFGLALGLDVLAAAFAAAGRADHAAFTYGVGEAYWRSVGHPQRGAPELQPVRDRCEETVRAALGDQGYSSSFARGTAAYGPTAVTDVLLLCDNPSPEESRGGGGAP